MSQKISALFFGTREFAAAILQGLTNDPGLKVTGVVTQPDKPVGRLSAPKPTPVKELAVKSGFPVLTPESLKPAANLDWPAADINIVAEYGKVIPREILARPRYGAINVHASLLPKYRGASPVQSAIINGENETGVTIMLMDEGLDTGPILAQRAVAIGQDETAEMLYKKLAMAGSELLLATLPGYISGTLKPAPQDNSLATVTDKLVRDSGRVDWHKPASEIYNLYRGLYPWPGIWNMWNGNRLKWLRVKPASSSAAAGELLAEHSKLYVGCADGSIEIITLQLEGGRALPASAFIAGYGARLSSAKLK